MQTVVTEHHKLKSERRVKVAQSCLTPCDPTDCTSPWNSPGQNTGVGSCSLLQGIFPAQGSSPDLPHCTWILYQLSHKGNPRILEWVACPFSSGPSQLRNWTRVSCIAGKFFTSWATGGVGGGVGINNKHLLITVLEAGMSRIKMLAGLVSDENLFPTDVCLLNTASHAGKDKQASRVSFYEGTNPIHRGSAFMI